MNQTKNILKSKVNQRGLDSVLNTFDMKAEENYRILIKGWEFFITYYKMMVCWGRVLDSNGVPFRQYLQQCLKLNTIRKRNGSAIFVPGFRYSANPYIKGKTWSLYSVISQHRCRRRYAILNSVARIIRYQRNLQLQLYKSGQYTKKHR